MTLDEARKIADIVAHADGGCSVCVGNLVDDLSDSFPEFKWEYNESADPGPEPTMEPYDDDAWEAWDKKKYECRVSVTLNG